MRRLTHALGIIALVVLLAYRSTPFHPQSLTVAAEANKTQGGQSNLVEVEEKSTIILKAYCSACHGASKPEQNLRLDQLELMDPVKRKTLFEKMQDVISLGEMPPADSKQPTKDERELLSQWLNSQLTGQTAKALEEKLQRFEYGNAVDHDDLFSGKYSSLSGFTVDRRWIVSEFIFNDKMNRLLNYTPTRSIYGKSYDVLGDSGVHWSPKTERGNKFRRTITNPFLLPEKVGVRYGAYPSLTTGHLLTMVGNAKRVAEHMSSEMIMKSHYPAMYEFMEAELSHRETVRAREEFLKTPSFMEQLLQTIYGKQHDGLLPNYVPKNIPYPGPPKHTRNGIQKRHDNLEFLERFDHEDIQSILQGIATYMRSDYRVEEVVSEGRLDLQGNRVWAPYRESDLSEFDYIIRQCELAWFREGVTDYRIKNRITTMKLFYDTWDMNKLYSHIKKGNYAQPKYSPLSDEEMVVISLSIRKHRSQGDHYREIIDKCLKGWDSSFKAELESTVQSDDGAIRPLIIELYKKIFERHPTDDEIKDNTILFKIYLKKLDRQQAVGKLIESLILNTEFAYRSEFGHGMPDEHGRRLMSSRDASYALAYALTDTSPDKELVVAVDEGRLSTREDYEREIRRILKRRDRWSVIDENVQAANLNPSVTNQPIRKLRFFREFFGYPNAQKVFKDDSRFGAGRHEPAVSRLIDEADMLVEYILEEDENVIEELLTTDRFFVYHSGDNEAMTAASQDLKKVYEYFKRYSWETWEPKDVAPHKEFMLTIWEFKKSQGGDEKSLLNVLKRMMPALELHFGEGQANGMPYMKVAMGFWHGGNVLGRTGQQMRGEQVTSYWNFDWKTWDYPVQQPAVMPNRKGFLTHPAWLIAHSQNLETDPIHRGKWIREKLLAGIIPDVPITVDAVIPPDHHKTLRQRMEIRTGDAYCWRCHQQMDPLGFAFEIFDDFGRYRTEERLEHPENVLREAVRGQTNEFGASLPIYKTLPVDPKGRLIGTGDDNLDGEVDDAFDLIERLSKSDRVRQSVIRHMFRYFLGRNETLADSKTLIDADKAYLDSGGSFDELIVSLLTSDSFIYRKMSKD